MNLIRVAIIVSLLSFLLGDIHSQIVTDRPDQTESSSTIPKKAIQIESGILIGYENELIPSTRQILLPTNLIRVGLSNVVELRVLSQFELLEKNGLSMNGISDLEIGTKVQLQKKKDKDLEIAFLTHLIVPSGSAELKGDSYGTSNKLSISHSHLEHVAIGYNIGYNYFGSGSGDLTYSIAFGFGVGEKVGLYIEPYGELSNMRDFVLNMDGGITYLINENTQFDFSFGTGINQRMNYISLGCSWLLF